MNWKESAIEDLKNYYKRQSALINLRERIESLKETSDGLKSVAADRDPVQGGASCMEDSMLNNIVEMERLINNYRAVKRLVDSYNRGINYLTEEEKTVLDGFYMRRAGRYVDDLCERLGYERTKIYQMKDRALYKFTIAMYGIVDY